MYMDWPDVYTYLSRRQRVDTTISAQVTGRALDQERGTLPEFQHKLLETEITWQPNILSFRLDNLSQVITRLFADILQQICSSRYVTRICYRSAVYSSKRNLMDRRCLPRLFTRQRKQVQCLRNTIGYMRRRVLNTQYITAFFQHTSFGSIYQGLRIGYHSDCKQRKRWTSNMYD